MKETRTRRSSHSTGETALTDSHLRDASQRPIGVQIEAQNLKGKKFKMTLEGFEARVFQHEYDHLDGVLYHDRMSPDVKATIQGMLDGFVEDYPGQEKAL